MRHLILGTEGDEGAHKRTVHADRELHSMGDIDRLAQVNGIGHYGIMTVHFLGEEQPGKWGYTFTWDDDDRDLPLSELLRRSARGQ